MGAGPIEVRFLGVQGWELKRGEDVVITGPMFSNPSWLEAATRNIKSDKAFVKERMSAMLSSDLAKAKVVLVGHGHYDHAMDVPAALEAIGPGATLFGNDTVAHMLCSQAIAVQVEPLESEAVDYDDPDPGAHWRYLPTRPTATMRILALRSEHSPQFERFRFYDAPPYATDLKTLPSNACDWRAGQPLAFLIDFLEPDHVTVAFRIHYGDSPTLAPCGFVPGRLDSGAPRKVDLAILTGGGAQSWTDYPKNLVDSSCAVRVVIGHWEDYFRRADDEDPRPLPGVKAFLDRVCEVRPDDACLPRPGTVFRFQPSGSRAELCATALIPSAHRECGCRPPS